MGRGKWRPNTEPIDFEMQEIEYIDSEYGIAQGYENEELEDKKF